MNQVDNKIYPLQGGFIEGLTINIEETTVTNHFNNTVGVAKIKSDLRH